MPSPRRNGLLLGILIDILIEAVTQLAVAFVWVFGEWGAKKLKRWLRRSKKKNAEK